ncbi:MAG: carboxymuconolactone decarboxylase [Candidatus Geothermincolia bacterium]
MAQLDDVTGSLTGEDRKTYELMLERRARQGAGLYGPYSALMNHPALAAHIEQLGYYYKFESEMPRDVYQFVVLSCARARSDGFEWADHFAHAGEEGVPPRVISALDGGDAGSMPEPYGLVSRLVGHALEYESIPEGLQAEAIDQFGVKCLLEIVTVCGFYGLITTVNKCFDVPPPSKEDR